MTEYHSVDMRLKILMMIMLVMHIEQDDTVLYMGKTGMVMFVVETNVGGMTADVVDKLTCSSDIMQPRQVDLMSNENLSLDRLSRRQFSSVYTAAVLDRYPTGITFTYLKSRALVDIVLYTCRYLTALHIYYTKEMDLFDFISHSDPTKVWIREQNLVDRKVNLLKITEGRTILLDPTVTAAPRDSDDSIDKMFDEGNDANQEHSVGKDDEVLEEVSAEKAKKNQKMKMTKGVSGFVYPPKKLRDDHQSLPPLTGRKSFSALRGMVPEGYAIPSDVAESLVTAFMTPVYDVVFVDSVSRLNLQTRPPHVRYVVSSDSSHYSGSYFETASLVRSVVDVPVVMLFITTTVDANVATGSKAKDAPKDFEHIGDSASAGGVDADAANISKMKKPSTSSYSFKASQSLDTGIMHRVYVPRWNVTNDSVLDDPYVCLGAEVTTRAEHTLERKSELEDICAEQATLLSDKDGKINHLMSLLSLKEVEAAEAISLRSQLSMVEAADAAKGTELKDLKEKNFSLKGEKNVLSERVEALESMAASKEVELVSLSSQVVNLTADLFGFQLSHGELNYKVVSLEYERDFLATQKNSLESAFELFKEQLEKMQDKQVGVLSDRRWILSRGLRLVLEKCLSSPEYLLVMGEAIGHAINKGIHDGLAVGIEHGIAGRSITDVTAFNPFAESDYIAAINTLQGVSFSLLAQLEANKDASMVDIMDLIRLEGPATETSKAHQLQPSLNQLMIPIYRLGINYSPTVSYGFHSLLVEPLSVRNLSGEVSSLMDFTIAATTAFSTTFAQSDLVPVALLIEVPPSPKVVFEEEELDTTPEHFPAL
nr:hypothetical protein [Tanacetum cinerariifolium]